MKYFAQAFFISLLSVGIAQTGMSQTVKDSIPGYETKDVDDLGQSRKQEKEPAPDEFVETEKEPQPLNLDELKLRVGYPLDAQKAGIQGKVVVRILIDKRGRYAKHIVLRNPSDKLSKPLERELPMLRFTPAILNGKPIACWITIPFDFRFK